MLGPLRTLLLTSCTPLLAQQTWIVDAGGGGNFTDLPAAILAAAPGDTLVVRAGSYTGASIDRALRILGVGSWQVFVGGLSVGPLTSGTVTLTGMRIGTLHTAATCSLDSLQVERTTVASDAAAMRGCTLGPAPSAAALTVHAGEVTLSGCTAYGAPSTLIVTRSCLVTGSHPAVLVLGGTVTIAGSVVHGAPATWLPCPYYSVTGYPSSAVANAGTLYVTESTLTAGGAPTGPAAVNGPFFGDPSTVTSPVSTTMSPVFLPATYGDVTGTGAAIACRLHTHPGFAAILGASLGVRASSPTPFGPAWLDPNAFAILRWGVTDAGGALSASIPLPAWFPRGLPVTVQGLAVSPTTGQFVLGTPTVVHLR